MFDVHSRQFVALPGRWTAVAVKVERIDGTTDNGGDELKRLDRMLGKPGFCILCVAASSLVEGIGDRQRPAMPIGLQSTQTSIMAPP